MKFRNIAHPVILCTLLLATAACFTKKDDEEKPQTPADQTTQARKGALPPGWENMGSNDMRTLLSGISWTTPNIGPRDCQDPSRCAMNGKIRVAISANTEAQLITSQNAGANGTVIASMDLQGPYKTAMYKLVPGNFTYYVVVFPSGSSLTWKLVQVGDSGNAPVRIIGNGEFRPCVSDQKAWGNPDANWEGCVGNNHVGNASFQAHLDSGGDGGGEQPGWLSCSEGCCTVSQAAIALNEIAAKQVAVSENSTRKITN